MARRSRRTRNSSKQSNRLIGWLVSYADEDMGESHELRAGRTLICAKDSGAKIITLNAPSVSNPHLALKAPKEQELIVQDIFTDSGSYVRRGDSTDEEQIDGPTKVEHGDWIRIGDSTRFQVCLVDGPHS